MAERFKASFETDQRACDSKIWRLHSHDVAETFCPEMDSLESDAQYPLVDRKDVSWKQSH